MGFKELVSDEVRRIEQALPHSDREVATLSDEDLTAHIEMLRSCIGNYISLVSTSRYSVNI